ncbi:MAG: DUF2892 domain-containing protein [Alphaproteobacteria bacterium]|nr:DUF2892 domain-containing protein [Alphaproteobacteria bacterium]
MHTNIGPTDCAFRLAAGIALLSLFLILTGPIQWLGVIGVVPLSTGLMRWCPVYAISGINTLPSR